MLAAGCYKHTAVYHCKQLDNLRSTLLSCGSELCTVNTEFRLITGCDHSVTSEAYIVVIILLYIQSHRFLPAPTSVARLLHHSGTTEISSKTLLPVIVIEKRFNHDVTKYRIPTRYARLIGQDVTVSVSDNVIFSRQHHMASDPGLQCNEQRQKTVVRSTYHCSK